MPNGTVQRLLSARVLGLLAEAAAVGELEHDGVVGRLRELLLQRLLRPLLPPTWSAATGTLVSSETERHSGQEDILIFNRDLIAPVFEEGEQAIIPVEACLAVVEVKSTLTAPRIDEAIAHARVIATELPRRYSRKPKPVSEEQKKLLGIPHGVLEHLSEASRPAYFLFAFDSDMTPGDEPKEWARLVERQRRQQLESSVIDGLCVASRGLYVGTPTPGFHLSPHRPLQLPGAPVISFVACLLDSLRLRNETRWKMYGFPMLASYIENLVEGETELWDRMTLVP